MAYADPVPAPYKIDLNTPGGRIRMLRMAKELTQEALAKKVFASQSSVAKWELNLVVPPPRTQSRLADVLGTVREFLYPDDKAA